MVSALVSFSSVPGLSLGWDIMLCYWAMGTGGRARGE